MEKIEIGQVVKPQGLKGELKVKPFASCEAFENLSYVYVGENKEKTKIEKAIYRLDFVYITLQGVDDRTKADVFRGKILSIDRSDLVVCDDALIIDDLLNMKVFLSSGEAYGEIISVEQYGSADILTISGKFGKWQVPYLSDLVESIDKANKVMVLNEKRFDEVKV